MESEISSKDIEIAHFVSSNKGDKIKETLKIQENQLNFLKESYQTMQDNLSEKQSKIRQLTQELKSHEDTQQENNKLRSEIQDLKDSQAQLEELLNQKCVELNDINATRSSSNESLMTYQSQNSELQKRVLCLETFINEQNNKISSQIADYEKLQKEFIELREIVSAKHHENVNYHNEIQR